MTPPPRDLIACAHMYLRRGFTVIPLKGKVPWDSAKRCNRATWPDLRLAPADLKAEFGPGVTGIGIALGEASGGLVDVDLDTPEAIALAPIFLPPTSSRFGRRSARESHWEFVVDMPIKTTKFHDIKRVADTSRSANGGEKKQMLVEIRSAGAQTMFPGSLHPDTAETVEYAEDGEPASVGAADLLHHVSWLAAATLVARSWPKASGTRHDTANALAGLLLRRGADKERVATLVAQGARVAGDEEWRERGTTARATATTLRAGKAATGGPTAEKFLGKEVVEKLCAWLPHSNSAYSAYSAGEDEEPAWEPLTPLEGIAVPPFPIDTLPPVLGNLARDVAAISQVPVDLVAVLGLGVAGAAAARRFRVQIGETHSESLNLYIAAVAGSGERKKAALREPLAPLESWEAKRRAEESPSIGAAIEQRLQDEERLKYLRKRAAQDRVAADREQAASEATELAEKLTQVPPLPTFLVSNTTPEKLEMLLEEQQGAICMASEEAGAVFEIAAGRYSKDGGAQLDTVLAAYDGGHIRTQRVGRAPVDVRQPELSILLTPQPIILQGFRDHPEFIHRGLVARFLFTVPHSLVGQRLYKDGKPNSAFRKAWEAHIHGILGHTKPDDPDAVCFLRFDHHALAHWKAQHDAIELAMRDGERLAGLREWSNKHPSRVARIAGILHLLTYSNNIERLINLETMRDAWAIGRYLIEHALAAHEMMGADEQLDGARRVLKWIRRKSSAQFSKKELFDEMRSHFKRVEALEPPLDLLIRHGYLRSAPEQSRSGPGRKLSPRFEVNPFAHNSQNTQNDKPEAPSGEKRWTA